MFDFTKLWDSRYLFGLNPLDLSRSDKIFFFLSLGFVALGMASKIFSLRSPRESPARFLLNRFFHLFFTIGFLGLLWAGARFENIPWLSTHIVVLGLFLIFAVWLVFIIRYFAGQHRLRQKLWDEEELKRKYLLKKK